MHVCTKLTAMRAVVNGCCSAAGDIIQSLLAQEQAAVVDVLEVQPEQPNLQKELIKRIRQ